MKQLKTIFLFMFTLILLFNMTTMSSYAISAPPEITAPSGVLIDAATGDVLYEKNAREIMYPASTTKIMTALLTLENADLDDLVVIDKDTPFTDGSRLYVIEGEIFTVEQLLYAIMVESANDAAIALAKHISGTVEDFSKLMNKRAKELGAKNTNFINPTGLPNEKHVSTAYDLAMITRHAMTIPKFAKLAKTVRYQIPPTNKQEETRYFKTSNRFLWGEGGRNKILYRGNWINIKYDLIEGIKTGYTLLAQQCLVASASKGQHRVISVVLKAEGANIYTDSRTLIDYGLEEFKYIKLVDNSKPITTAEVNGGIIKEVNLIPSNELYKAFPKDQLIGTIHSEIVIHNDINAPIEKYEVLGKVLYKMDTKIIGEVDLIADTSVPSEDSLSMLYLFNEPSSSRILNISTLAVSIFMAWRTFVTLKRIKKKKNRKYYGQKIERHSTRKLNFYKMTQIYKKR